MKVRLYTNGYGHLCADDWDPDFDALRPEDDPFFIAQQDEFVWFEELGLFDEEPLVRRVDDEDSGNYGDFNDYGYDDYDD